MTVIVERHRYVADWFERDQMELDLEHTIYEFNYRFGGSWFLEAKHHDGEKWQPVVWCRGNSFDIAYPAHALVALCDRVVKFSAISIDMQFYEALAKLLADAESIKKRQGAQS